MKLNLGCASQVHDGWVNVDYALGARFMKIPLFRVLNRKVKLFNLDWSEEIYIHDLTKKFPWADSSIDIVYTSHTLGYFSKNDGRRFLAECYRVLRKGGIIRVVVPDLRHDVIEYIEGRIYADDFLDKLNAHGINCNNRFKKLLSLFFSLPYHNCMYDNSRLVTILGDIGFQVSDRAAFDSDIEEIRLIELKERTENAVIVEGRKR